MMADSGGDPPPGGTKSLIVKLPVSINPYMLKTCNKAVKNWNATTAAASSVSPSATGATITTQRQRQLGLIGRPAPPASNIIQHAIEKAEEDRKREVEAQATAKMIPQNTSKSTAAPRRRLRTLRLKNGLLRAHRARKKDSEFDTLSELFRKLSLDDSETNKSGPTITPSPFVKNGLDQPATRPSNSGLTCDRSPLSSEAILLNGLFAMHDMLEKSKDPRDTHQKIADHYGKLRALRAQIAEKFDEHMDKRKELRMSDRGRWFTTSFLKALDPQEEQEYAELGIQPGEALTARECVLFTTELLENVLVHLPANDILRCQSVCKAFHNCYQSSLQLKLKTFEEVDRMARGMTRIARPTRLSMTGAAGNGNLANVNNGGINAGGMNTAGLNGGTGTTRGRNSLPVPSLNPLLLDIAPRGNHQRPFFYFKGAVGIRHAKMVWEPGKMIQFDITFNHHRFSNSWKTVHTGSWTKQSLSDPAFGLELIVHLKDEKTEATDQGEVTIRKSARVSMETPATRTGQLIKIAQYLNQKLIDQIFDLPPRVPGWCAVGTEHLRFGGTGKIECVVNTQTIKQKLN